MSFSPFFNYVPNSNYINHFSSYPPKFSDKLNDNLIININDYNKVKDLVEVLLAMFILLKTRITINYMPPKRQKTMHHMKLQI